MKNIFLFAAAFLLLSFEAQAAGDGKRGEELYNARCIACHSPNANRAGPMHRGVIGRKAGSVEGYNYSNAVKASSVVWDEATLDQWLAGPSIFIPGTKMPLKVSEAKDRADIIVYLATLK